MNPDFEAGYNAGLVNDRECPHSLMYFVQRALWCMGNEVGVRIHCAVVEWVYLNTTHEEGN